MNTLKLLTFWRKEPFDLCAEFTEEPREKTPPGRGGVFNETLSKSPRCQWHRMVAYVKKWGISAMCHLEDGYSWEYHEIIEVLELRFEMWLIEIYICVFCFFIWALGKSGVSIFLEKWPMRKPAVLQLTSKAGRISNNSSHPLTGCPLATFDLSKPWQISGGTSPAAWEEESEGQGTINVATWCAMPGDDNGTRWTKWI